MEFKDHFSKVAEAYAAARPGYPDELFAFLAEQAPARARAWDCACGNGQAAVGLARYFDAVQASDASREQIAQSIARPNITYSVQMAERTDFNDAGFDLVSVATALHWFDLGRFYHEVNRVLRPRGILAAYSYRLFKVSSELDPIIERMIFDPIKPYWPPENRLAREGYRSLEFPFDEIEMPQFRMRLSWTFGELKAYLGTWSALRRFIAAEGPGSIAEALERVRAVWGDPRTRKEISMDLVGRIGRRRSCRNRPRR